MPSWNNSESSSDELLFVGDGESSENSIQVPDTLYDPDFFGTEMNGDAKCDHLERLAKYVAFEGQNTGRRFLGCARAGGGVCSTVNWIDPEWPAPLKKCLVRLWELYDEECNLRITGNVKHAEANYKLSLEKKELEEKVKGLQIDLGKALEASQVPNQMNVHLDVDVQVRQDTEKKLNDLVAENKALYEQSEGLKVEKKKLEYYIADLLNASHVQKDKLKKLKEILDD